MSTAHDEADPPVTPAKPKSDAGSHPQRIGVYEIKKKIGAGGMGAVYLALDTELKRTVALKVLPPEKAENPILVRRFKSEAQNAAQLRHENIVSVYDAGESEGYCYIALEYVEGIDVHDLVERRGVLPVSRSLDIVRQVAKALQHAHEKGIVHRDIKPSNLLIRRDGTVKLADMGLARSIDETTETGITRAGTTVGTVDYMSPEQARDSKSADFRSDVYSLGCTWYHMLTGSPPFPEGSLTNKLRAHAHSKPPDPRDKNPNVPEGIVAVLQRMMAKEPKDRYQTPKELLEELQGANVSRDAVTRKILAAVNDDDGFDMGDEEPGEHHSEGSTVEQDVAPASPKEKKPEPESNRSAKREEAPQAKRSDRKLPKREERHAPEPEEPEDEPPETESIRREPTTTRKMPGRRDEVRPDSSPSERSGEKSRTERELPPRAMPQRQATSKKAAPEPKASKPKRSLPPIFGGRGNRPAASAEPTAKPVNGGEPTKRPVLTPKGILVLALVLIACIALFSMKSITQRFGSLFQVQAPPPTVNPFDQGGVSSVPGAQQGVRSGAGGGDPEGETRTAIVDEQNPNADPNTNANQTAEAPPLPAAPDPTADPTKIPEWVEHRLAAASTGSPVVVRSGASGAGSLGSALGGLGAGGGVVELANNGPFTLRPADLKSGMVTLRAAKGVRPMVLLLPSKASETRRSLRVKGGSLELENIDFVLDGEQFPSSDPLTLIGVEEGHLFVRDCSFTMKGTRKGPTLAFELSGLPAAGDGRTRLLLEKTLVRGDGLQALKLETERLDAVVRDSLIVTGAAGLLTLPSNADTQPNGRVFRLVASTYSGQGDAFAAKGKAEPPATILVVRNSLVAAAGGDAPGALLSVDDWPGDSVREHGPFKKFEWKPQRSVIAGWKLLLKTNQADLLAAVDSPDQWNRLWKSSNTEEEIIATVWPKPVSTPLIDLPLSYWAPEAVEGSSLKTEDGHFPGAAIGPLHVPDLSRLGVGMLLASKPAGLHAFTPSRTIAVDANKQDLGKVLADREIPDGSVVEVSGFGNRTSSPIVIRKKSIQIVFRQMEGAQFVITPRVTTSAKGHEAFITIENGRLDLVHGNFVFPYSDQNVLPWFITAGNASFSLQNCEVHVPLLPQARSRGMFRWIAPAEPAVGGAGDYRHVSQVVDSLLVGSETLFNMDLGQQGLILRNTVAVSREDLFQLRSIKGAGGGSAALDLEQCTLSAGRNVFQIDVKREGNAPPPLRVFLNECAYVSPVKEASGAGPTLLVAPDPAALAHGLVEWWEEGCGYGGDYTSFVQKTGEPKPKDQPFESWTQLWGGRVQRPLVGTNGVLLKTLLPTRTTFKPQNFELLATSKANTWGVGGHPIGANVAVIDAPTPKAETKATAKPKAKAAGGANKQNPQPGSPAF
ncbi:MAG TPA: protein kinase [Planctomycetaceae bacterium]|nr:protein kinase [Planctomycetaceae bacterium]